MSFMSKAARGAASSSAALAKSPMAVGLSEGYYELLVPICRGDAVVSVRAVLIPGRSVSVWNSTTGSVRRLRQKSETYIKFPLIVEIRVPIELHDGASPGGDSRLELSVRTRKTLYRGTYMVGGLRRSEVVWAGARLARDTFLAEAPANGVYGDQCTR